MSVQYGKSLVKKKRVYYSGSDTLTEGQALCYDWDSVTNYQNVADSTILKSTYAASRRMVVEKPSYSNSMHFAGVVAPESVGITDAGWITIYEPGSICNISLYSAVDHRATQDTAANSGTVVTFCRGQYYFMEGGFSGTGSATILEDVDRSAAAGLCMAELHTGQQCGGYSVITMLSLAISTAVSSPFANVGVFGLATASIAGNMTHVMATTGAYMGARCMFKVNTVITVNTIRFIVSTGDSLGMVSTRSGGHDYVSSYADISSAGDYIDCTWKGAAVGWICESSDSAGLVT